MKSPSNVHWGSWIKDRAKAVGFLRDSDFATAVGCCRKQLVNWFSFSAPPAHMRKGFDASLIAALKTDRETLFVNFSSIPASTAPRIDALKPRVDEGEHARRRVLAIIELMPDQGLKELARVGEQLLRGGTQQVA